MFSMHRFKIPASFKIEAFIDTIHFILSNLT